MVESSKDILFLVIAFCVLLFTGFVCWFIFYLIRIVRGANEMVQTIKEKVELVGDILESIRSKINSASSYFPMIAKGVSQLAGFIKSRRERQESKPKNNNRKK